MPDEQAPIDLESEEMAEAGAPERRADRKRGPAWVMWVILALLLLLVLLLVWSYLRGRSGDGTAVTPRSVIYGPSAIAPPGEEPSGEVPESNKPTVPDVVGLMRSPAVSKLEARGYSAHVTVLYSSDKPRGVVFEQVPSAGSFADPGATVNILVSEGTRPSASVRLPDFTGMKRDAAVRQVEALGLEAKVMVTASYKGRRRVYEQSPAAGTNVAKGSKVFLLVTIPD